MSRVAITISEEAINTSISQHLFWIAKEGDTVKAGGTVASIEACKGMTFINAPVSGVLCNLVIPKGASVCAGDVIGYIEEE